MEGTGISKVQEDKVKYSISVSRPLEDYQNLIATLVQVDEIVDDDVTKENFTKTAEAARDVIWRLLFNTSSVQKIKEAHEKAAELLEEYKSDACFYEPWPYNEWIYKLRDEVLKNNFEDFWRETIVKKQLGPCWSRDSDLFDSDDTPPLEFYDRAGCVAPFAASLKIRSASETSNTSTNATIVSVDDNDVLTGNFEANIGKNQPLADYRQLVKRFILSNINIPDEVQKKSFDKISKAAQFAIWSLLFESTPTKQEFDKAAELLQEYKTDASFYQPYKYNEWIVLLRDEVLKHELSEFWREIIVKLELGPCCARDSDLFEESDPLPIDFYNHGGCKAPFVTRLSQ